jgi:hypothetical protein
MPLYFFKPVVWNDKGYLRPGGGKFVSGYPAKHGYGHEEWNNSNHFEFVENRRRFRIFHTEGFGNQPLSTYSGHIFVFMIASFQGKQYLVAVAGQATSLFDDEPERARLIRKLRLDRDDRPTEAWQVSSVRRAYNDNRTKFLNDWKKELTWLPTWRCPAQSYLGLKTPLALDSKQLTGRKRLITMYSSYQEIDRHVASRVLDLIPTDEGAKVVVALKSLCASDRQDIPEDVSRIENDVPNETTRKALVDARLGQGAFRDALIQLWGGCCAVTGCAITEILRASHVNPWRESTNKERLDAQNGLLLGAHLDALFDAGLIGFDGGGSMLISERVSRGDRLQLRLGGRLRTTPSDGLKRYLAYHRKHVGLAIGGPG